MTEDLDFVSGVLVSLAVIVLLSIFFVAGWGFAHSTIAIECKKLGGFYVGDTVFQCSAASEKGARNDK